MELFIQIKNGQPFEHPIFGDNFRLAFPHVDVDNLPPEFARFTRISAPVLGPYQVLVSTSYEKNADGYSDAYHVRDMTPEERAAKREFMLSLEHAEAAIFNEELCEWVLLPPNLTVPGSAPDVIG